VRMWVKQDNQRPSIGIPTIIGWVGHGG
jgi:hypothetical protein